MPTYNEEKCLDRCLRSLRAQEFPGTYELIIADGGSDDRTREIAKKYADKIVIEPIRTIAAGRQKGTRAARGKIIVYAGADVIMPQGWLVQITKPFKDPAVAAVTGKPMAENPNLAEKLFCDFILHPLTLVMNALSLYYVYGDNFAIRKSVFDKIGGFNIHFATGEDTDIIKRANQHGKIAYNPEAYVFSSNRRWKKWGMFHYLFFHTTNFIDTHLFNRPHTEYEVIR